MRPLREGPTLVRWRVLGIIALSILAQTTVLSHSILGTPVRVDLPFMIVVAVALRVRPSDAALTAFATGLAVDSFSTGPFGQHAFAFTASAYVLALLARRTDRDWGFLARSIVGPVSVAVSWLLLIGMESLATGVDPVARLATPPLGFIAGAVIGVHLASVLASNLGLVQAGLDRRREWSGHGASAGHPRFTAP